MISEARLPSSSIRVALHRFEQEAFAASALSHPNILVIYEIGAEADRHFIATEFIEGETLRDRMARKKMDLEDALDVAIQQEYLLLISIRGNAP